MGPALLKLFIQLSVFKVDNKDICITNISNFFTANLTKILDEAL